jgi:hypothetical protein
VDIGIPFYLHLHLHLIPPTTRRRYLSGREYITTDDHFDRHNKQFTAILAIRRSSPFADCQITYSPTFTCFHQGHALILAIGTMSEPEQCIICLEPLPHPHPKTSTNGALLHHQTQPPPLSVNGTSDGTTAANAIDIDDESNYHNIIAVLDGCEHIIHDKCIRSWAEKTNSCPICRNAFHIVSVFNGVDGESCEPWKAHGAFPPPFLWRYGTC